jgi:hypothetical protein
MALFNTHVASMVIPYPGLLPFHHQAMPALWSICATYPAGIATTTKALILLHNSCQQIQLHAQLHNTHTCTCTVELVGVSPQCPLNQQPTLQNHLRANHPSLSSGSNAMPPSFSAPQANLRCSRNPLLRCHTCIPAQQPETKSPFCPKSCCQHAATPWAVHSTKQLAAPQLSSPSKQHMHATLAALISNCFKHTGRE